MLILSALLDVNLTSQSSPDVYSVSCAFVTTSFTEFRKDHHLMISLYDFQYERFWVITANQAVPCDNRPTQSSN